MPAALGDRRVSNNDGGGDCSSKQQAPGPYREHAHTAMRPLQQFSSQPSTSQPSSIICSPADDNGDQQPKPDQAKAASHVQQHMAVVEGSGNTESASVPPEMSPHQAPASAESVGGIGQSLDVTRSSEPQACMITLREAAAVPLPAASAGRDAAECGSGLSLVSQVQNSRLQGASFAEKHAALSESLTALRPTLGLKLSRQLQQQLLTPTILAVGPPSSGKSSLLEGLSKCPIFPHNSCLGGIAPVRLETSPCATQDQPKYEVTFNGECFVFFQMEEVRPCVTGILERIAASHHPRSCEELQVVVSEPGLSYSSLVDLPSINDGSPAHQEATWEIAKTYLAQPGTIALCVSSAVSPFEWHPVSATLVEDSPAKRTGSKTGLGNSEASASKRGTKREPGAAMSRSRTKPRVGTESWVNTMCAEVASRKTSIVVITMADLAPNGLLQPNLFGHPSTADAARWMVSEQCQLDPLGKRSRPSIMCSEADSDAEPESPPASSAGEPIQRRSSDKRAAISGAKPVKEGQYQEQRAKCAVINGEHAASDTQQSFAESEELEASLFQNMLDATGLKLSVSSWEDLASEHSPGSLRCSPEQQQLQGQQLNSIAGCLGLQNLQQHIARTEGIAADEVREAMFQKLQAASAEGQTVLRALSTDPKSLHVPTFLANLSHSISHEAIFSTVMKCPTRGSRPDAIPGLLRDHPQLYADLFTPCMTLKDLERAWEGIVLAQLPSALLREVLSALVDEMSNCIELWLGRSWGASAPPSYLLPVQGLIFSDLIQLDPLLHEYTALSVIMKRRLQEQLQVGTIAASVLSMVEPLLAALRGSLDGSVSETGDLHSLVRVATAQAVYSAFTNGLVMRLLPEGFVLEEAKSAAEKRKAANLTLESACKATMALRSFGDPFGFREGFARQLPNAAAPNMPAASSRPQAEAEPSAERSAASGFQDVGAPESGAALQSSQPEPAAPKLLALPNRASLYVFNAAWPTFTLPKGTWQLQVDSAAYTFDKRNSAWPTARGSPGWFLSLSDCFNAEISTSKEDGFVFNETASLVVFHAREHESEKRICALHFHSKAGFNEFVKKHEAREFENATSMSYREDILQGLDQCEDNADLEAENEAAEDTTGMSDGECDEDDASASEEDDID